MFGGSASTRRRDDGAQSASSVQCALALERLRNASLMSDVRDIIADIRKYASTCQHVIVSTGMPILTKALRASVQDDDVAQHVLGLLIDILADGTPTPGSAQGTQTDCEAACKAIVSELANIPAILDLVRRGSLMTKVSAMTLLSSLVRRNSALTCTALQKSRTAMSTLLSTLDDPRDEVRNEVLALLMLITDASEELRSIVAFDDGFERLLGSVVKALEEPPLGEADRANDEDGEEDENTDTPRGESAQRRVRPPLDLQSLVMASDCLTVVRNVLKGNAIAQRLFLEGKHLRSCVCVLDLPQRLNDELSANVAAGTRSTTSQHVRLCLMLAVGIVDTLVSAKQRISAWHSSHQQLAASDADRRQQYALSSTDAAILLRSTANDPSGPSIASACDSIAAVPGLLEGMANIAVGTCPAVSPELRATTLVVLTGLAAASEPARQILGELLCADADVRVLQSFTPAVPLADVIQSPGFSLASTCVAVASVASESRPAREGATMLLQSLFLGNTTSRTALLAHAFAPPPVPLPTSLYNVALQQAPLRFTAALSMVDARKATDVMAQVSPPGLVLLSALIMSCDSVSSSSRSRPIQREWLHALLSSCHILACATHSDPTHMETAQEADASGAELFARLTVARILPNSRMYSSDTTLLQAVLRCFAQRLHAGMQGANRDTAATDTYTVISDVIILTLGRLLLCCTRKCFAAASAVWAEVGPLLSTLLTGKRGTPLTQTVVAALLGQCWLYGMPDLRSSRKKIASATDAGIREAVEASLGGSSASCLQLIAASLAGGQQHDWFVSAREGSPQALMVPLMSVAGQPSEESIVAVDSFFARELDAIASAVTSSGAGVTAGLAAGAAAAPTQDAPLQFASPQHERVVGLSKGVTLPQPDFSSSSAEVESAAAGVPPDNRHGNTEHDQAVVASLQAEKSAWEAERVAWSNAVQEREDFIRQQQQQIAELSGQLEAARAGTAPQSTYPPDLMPRAEAEATIEGWRAALAERDAALARLEGERNEAFERAEKADARVALVQAGGMPSPPPNSSQIDAEAWSVRLTESENRCAQAIQESEYLRSQQYDLQQQLHAAHAQAHHAQADLDALRAQHFQAQTGLSEVSARSQILSERLIAAEAELQSARHEAGQAAEAAEAATRDLLASVQAARTLAKELRLVRAEQAHLLAVLAVQEERVSLLNLALLRVGMGQEAQKIEEFTTYALQQVNGTAADLTSLSLHNRASDSKDLADSALPTLQPYHQRQASVTSPPPWQAQSPPVHEQQAQTFASVANQSFAHAQTQPGAQDQRYPHTQSSELAVPVPQQYGQEASNTAQRGHLEYTLQTQYSQSDGSYHTSSQPVQAQAEGQHYFHHHHHQEQQQHNMSSKESEDGQPSKLFASAVQLGSLFGGLARSAVKQVATAATGAGLASAAQDLLLQDDVRTEPQYSQYSEGMYGGHADGQHSQVAASDAYPVSAPLWAGTAYSVAPAEPEPSAVAESSGMGTQPLWTATLVQEGPAGTQPTSEPVTSHASDAGSSSEVLAQDAVFRPFAEVLGQSGVGPTGTSAEGTARARSRTRSRSGNVSTAGSDILGYVARGSAQSSQGLSRPASEVFSGAAFDAPAPAVGDARSGNHTPAAVFFGSAAPQSDAAAVFQTDSWGDIPLDSAPQGEVGYNASYAGSDHAPSTSSQQQGLTDVDLDSSVPTQQPWAAAPVAGADTAFTSGLQAIDLGLGAHQDGMTTSQAGGFGQGSHEQVQQAPAEAQPGSSMPMWTGTSYSGYANSNSAPVHPPSTAAPYHDAAATGAPPMNAHTTHSHPTRPQYVQYPQYAAAPVHAGGSSVAAAAQFFSTETEDSHSFGMGGGMGGQQHDPSSSAVYDPRHGGWHDRGGMGGGPDGSGDGGGESTPFPVLSFVGGLMSSVAKTVVKEAKSVAQTAAAEVAKAQPSITNAVSKAGPLPGLLNLAGSMVGLGSSVHRSEQGQGFDPSGSGTNGYYDSAYGQQQEGGGYDAGGASGATWYGSSGAGPYDGQSSAASVSSGVPTWSGTSTGGGPSVPAYPTSSTAALQAPPMYAAAPMQPPAPFGYGSYGDANQGGGMPGHAFGAGPGGHGAPMQGYGGMAAGGTPGLQPYGGTLYKGQRRVGGAGARRPSGQ